MFPPYDIGRIPLEQTKRVILTEMILFDLNIFVVSTPHCHVFHYCIFWCMPQIHE